MEVLHILEEKIARLIESKKKDMEIIADLKNEVSELKKENASFRAHIEKLEDVLLAHDKQASKLNQESEQTRVAVDELIGSIDALMEEERS